jgi:hypothetical protein
MASHYIGVIVGGDSGEIYAVINPDTDRQLFNPRFWLLQNSYGEPVKLVRVLREDYMAADSIADLLREVQRRP